MQTDKRHVFHSLDALRGVAALAVVTFHGRDLFGPLHLSSAYLAVDLFFVLSGFVIAHAYGRKLDQGMTFGAFMRVRLIRLYPLYILGVLIAAALVGLQLKLHTHALPSVQRAASASLNFLGIPSVAGATLYPLDPPAWSLFYELLANALTALIWARLTNLRLALIVAVSGLLTAAAAFHHGSLDVGFHWDTAYVALPRVMFSFFGGVWLYRLKLKAPAISVWALAAAVVAIFAVTPPALRWVYDLGVVLFVFPAMVVAGSQASKPIALFDTAGRISYAVYTIHVPLLRFAHAGLKMSHLHLSAYVVTPVALATIVGLAWAADQFDKPARDWISERLAPPRRPLRAAA